MGVHMKRKTALIETGRNGAAIFYDQVRVIGVNKKTGLVWVKGPRQTRLVEASEILVR